MTERIFNMLKKRQQDSLYENAIELISLEINVLECVGEEKYKNENAFNEIVKIVEAVQKIKAGE